MSEGALLSFGCGVSFLVLAAVYIFVTEEFRRTEQPQQSARKDAESEREKFPKAA